MTAAESQLVIGSLSKACNHQRATHSFLYGVALGHAREGKVTQDTQNIPAGLCSCCTRETVVVCQDSETLPPSGRLACEMRV